MQNPKQLKGDLVEGRPRSITLLLSCPELIHFRKQGYWANPQTVGYPSSIQLISKAFQYCFVSLNRLSRKTFRAAKFDPRNSGGIEYL
jgi:hypothetical protein